MPSDIMNDWLVRNCTYNLMGRSLRPQQHPLMLGTALSAAKGQAEAFYLQASDKSHWILKKFHKQFEPERGYTDRIASLLPKLPQFSSGYNRQILARKSLGRIPRDLQDWLDGAILMPRIRGYDWACLADRIRDGSITLTEDQRKALCRNLCELITALESAGLSHRDLSSGNVFIDEANLEVHLIDWDSLYHKSLPMPQNTTCGTPGYVAPFALSGGQPDARLLWNEKADRFALAIMCVEFLAIERGSALGGDGGLFTQQELNARSGPALSLSRQRLVSRAPLTVPLFERALRATDCDCCPTSSEWHAACRTVAPIAPLPPISDHDFMIVLNRRSTVQPIFHAPVLPAAPDFTQMQPPKKAAPGPTLPENPWRT
ncbi:MAG: protein kinase domain-containing protein [Sulfobacillus sp.]